MWWCLQRSGDTPTGGSTSTIYPLAADTVYRNTDGTGAETTSYAYTWLNDSGSVASNQPYSVATTSPIVTAGQNGPGTADVSVDVYDAYARIDWTKDADGYINYRAYDANTGGLVLVMTPTAVRTR